MLTLTVHAASFGFVDLAPSTVVQGTYARGFRSDVVRWTKDGKPTTKAALMLTSAQVAAVKAADPKADADGLVTIDLPEGKRGRKPKPLKDRPAWATDSTARKPRQTRTTRPSATTATDPTK
jgi:hypothetical protein